jgi:hypothetical protein
MPQLFVPTTEVLVPNKYEVGHSGVEENLLPWLGTNPNHPSSTQPSHYIGYTTPVPTMVCIPQLPAGTLCQT